MTPWIGKLYVFKDDSNREFVSAANPVSRGIERTHIRAYQVTGPFMPVGWPKPVPVEDAPRWIDELRLKGFSIEPCTVD